MDFRSGSPSDNSGAEEMEVSMTKPKHKVVSEHSRNNNIYQVFSNVDEIQLSRLICSHNNYTVGYRCSFWRKQLSELSRYQAKPDWVHQSSELRCPYCMAFKADSSLELVCLFSIGTEPEITAAAGPCDCVNSLQADVKIFQWICRMQGESGLMTPGEGFRLTPRQVLWYLSVVFLELGFLHHAQGIIIII